MMVVEFRWLDGWWVVDALIGVWVWMVGCRWLEERDREEERNREIWEKREKDGLYYFIE